MYTWRFYINALVIQAPTTLVLQMLNISSFYITSLRFRRFMMIKNELELSSLNIWSFTYRKRAGGPEPRNWPELSPPTRHSVSGSAPYNKVTPIPRCYNMSQMHVTANNFYWSLRKSKINGNIVITKISRRKTVFESISIVFKIIYMGFVAKIQHISTR